MQRPWGRTVPVCWRKSEEAGAERGGERKEVRTGRGQGQVVQSLVGCRKEFGLY